MQRAHRPARSPLAWPKAARAVQVVGLLAVVMSSPAWALYKVVGPDGKVTYTDRPSTDRPSQTIRANGATSSTGSLPLELRQVASKYPVTLYSSRDCAPCDQGRSALQRRGIPFSEKLVETKEDIDSLQRLEGSTQVPVLRIGQQQMRGFQEREWMSYLDAAGYPAKSVLPPGYAWRSATPLVQVTEAPVRAKPIPPMKRETPIVPPVGQPEIPPGFRF
ncbi:MAG TPA: glutaredoxin family protein [Aquabacterium sp.]|uniref:glutaredoxin family protein n=1 Tax=Aquabacterium sp. TaxID=1872578 RepID=UPI002E313E22|nr:glutaredoxin family protein [Aquabacterium sp.]HEX5373566.1 glutaredoxin family protein [Aquabacterium sp.]